MHRIYIIARREYLAMVATKGFLIGLIIMPIFMIGGAFVPGLLMNRTDKTSKTIVVIDHTKTILPQLQQAATRRNETELVDPRTKKVIAEAYKIEAAEVDDVNDTTRFKLSEQVRSGEIQAFLEIPANILISDVRTPAAVRLYAENAAFSDMRDWLREAVNGIVRTSRLRSEGIDTSVVARASLPVAVTAMNLYQRAANGKIQPAEESNNMAQLIFPMSVMMLMFMVTFMSAQSVLECVIGEKQLKIGELLLASATPFQIMAGKLIGSVLGSITMMTLYLAVGLSVAYYKDLIHRVPLDIIPWMIIYQILLVFIYSSMFLAIAAAVNDMKEAGALLLPVWLILMIPLYSLIVIIREPNGSIATTLSFIPFITPLVMVMRMAVSDAVPLWQPIFGIVIVLATCIFVVFAAGRIFRIGILAQGKAPKFTTLIRWVITG